MVRMLLATYLECSTRALVHLDTKPANSYIIVGATPLVDSGFYNESFRLSFPPFPLFSFAIIICSLIFHSGEQDNLNKRINLA